MSDITTAPTDVLVIGAGPTGLTLACDLARRGVTHRIIERADAYSTASRAKTIMPRALEVADDLGAVASIVSKGRADMPARYYTADGGAVDKPGVAVAADSSLVTPYPDPVWIAEFHVEAALRERHAQLGGHVELATTAIDLSQDPDGVTVTVTTPSGTQTIWARYVVGADGGKSRVRQLIDAPLVGQTYETQRWYLGDVHLDGDLDRGRMHVWFSSKGMLGLTPLPSTDLWQLQSTIPADVTEPEHPSLELYQAMLDRRNDTPDARITSASWLSIYRVNVRMVDHYRNARVLLAGDAAHVHSPAGGQGMNTGIQDAYNLGWKLDAVLRGADGALLDSYDEERRPVARAVLEDSTSKLGAVMRTVNGSATPSTSLGAISDDLTSGLRISYPSSSLSRLKTDADAETDADTGGPRPGDRAPDATGLHGQDFDGNLFDLFRGPHWTLLAFTDNPPPALPGIDSGQLHVHWITRPGATSTIGILDRDGNARRVYATDGRENVLIRPDGHIALRGDSDEPTLITDYLTGRLGPVGAGA